MNATKPKTWPIGMTTPLLAPGQVCELAAPGPSGRLFKIERLLLMRPANHHFQVSTIYLDGKPFAFDKLRPAKSHRSKDAFEEWEPSEEWPAARSVALKFKNCSPRPQSFGALFLVRVLEEKPS